jgi:hypothetical protein
MSVRNRMREFIRLVHPDLGGNLPAEVISMNLNSLMELNAYVDRLESASLKDTPFVARNLQFFTPVITRKHDIVRDSIRPFEVLLESISPGADLFDKRALSDRLLSRLQEASKFEPTILHGSRETREVQSILSTNSSKQGSMKTRLSSIWRNEKERDQITQSLYETPDRDQFDSIAFREYKSMLLHNKIVRTYSRLSNRGKRERRLASIQTNVYNSLSGAPMEESSSFDYTQGKLKLISSGYHPDLVFFRPHLTPDQKTIGMRNVCGEFLSTNEDVWLLENVWEAMRRSKKPSVPIVLSDTWAASHEGGFIEVPYDFKLSNLVDFLEDNLETIREARKQLLDNFTAV